MTATQTAHRWVKENRPRWSAWNAHVFDLGETAWREYRSAAWYVERLRAEGFTVEEGSGGMPTAFCAHWSNGGGSGARWPTLMAYAEYDAVPGNCQIAAPYRAPRPGLSRHAGGHTDPHSALGMSALAGTLAAKAAMEAHGIPRRATTTASTASSPSTPSTCSPYATRCAGTPTAARSTA